MSSPLDPDSAIRSTDLDASGSRLSAVNKGYLSDPFIKLLVPRPHLQPARPPLINIGTYIRGTALDELIDGFIQLAGENGCQIISLGAGSDTRYWRLSTGPQKARIKRYIELDFPEVTAKKAMAIKKSKDLSNVLQDVSIVQGGSGLRSLNYHLLPVDLRHPPEQALSPILGPIISTSLPTLLLFECVLAYMSPEASSAILEWFVRHLNSIVLGSIVYEMFGLRDSFGQVMLNNMRSRNVTLPGVEPYHNQASLPTRFLKHGFTDARALTLKQIRKTYISASESERISKLEFLDEVEELDLVLDHYAITWGTRIPAGSDDAAWSMWKLAEKEQRIHDSDDD